MGRFATGVAVVSYATPEGPRGITINSFTSVSLDPPLVLVSVARTSRTHDLLQGVPFTVNVLGAEHEDLAAQLARGKQSPPQAWSGENPPYLVDSLARMQCEPWDRFDAGDHSLFVGEVVDLAYRDGDALGFHMSQFLTIGAGEVA